MDPTSILVATVAVFGTLLSPVVHAKVTHQARNDELRLEREHQLAKAEHDRMAARSTELKTCYIRHNSAAREYAGALKEWAFRQRQHDRAASGAELLQARADYRASYAEAQMVVSDEVLDRARVLNGALGDVYGVLKRLEEGGAQAGDSLESAFTALNGIWDPLSSMRSRMREDLGSSLNLPDPGDGKVLA